MTENITLAPFFQTSQNIILTNNSIININTANYDVLWNIAFKLGILYKEKYHNKENFMSLDYFRLCIIDYIEGDVMTRLAIYDEFRSMLRNSLNSKKRERN